MEPDTDEPAPPRVQKRDRKAHLSYDSRYRIHCATIYPLPTPNGSSLIVQGHARGLSVLWRGGKRPKEGLQSDRNEDIILVDSHEEEDDGEREKLEIDDELDPDCPCPSIVQSMMLELGTAVLHLAIPSLPTGITMQTPTMLRTNVPVAVTCGDGTLRIINLPLQPPTNTTKEKVVQKTVQQAIQLPVEGYSQQRVSVKARLLGENDPARSRSRSRGPKPDGELLVAGLSTSLSIWRLLLTSDTIRSPKQPLLQRVNLSYPAHQVTFHPSAQSTQLLIADCSGAVRIYDPYAPKNSYQRPTSRDSTTPSSTMKIELGKWLTAFCAPFTESPEASSHPALGRRKSILDAQWVLGGRGILALLEDAAWGIWDPLSSAASGKRVEDFAIQGFLNSASTHEASHQPQAPKRSSTRLAPMTPNTRKAKAESLFVGAPTHAGAANQGGISVVRGSARGGQTDESVMMWYDSDLYTIPSVQAFYQRSASSSGLGSLYAPGLIHVSDIDLGNENISSVAQFGDRSSSSLGQMNTQRDLLVIGEHRYIILENLQRQGRSRQLFQPAATSEIPTSRDQRMLDAGDLDLGGMDRVLDRLANGDSRARKVGFAH